MPRGPVLFVASSGGHLQQLIRLRDTAPADQRIWITFDRPDARSLLDGEEVVHAYHPTNRNLPNLIRNLFLALQVVRRHRPRAVLTTGAGVAVPFCWIGRLFRARVVYVESMTRIHGLSLSAKLAYPVVSELFVQWPDLASAHGKATYAGSVVDLS